MVDLTDTTGVEGIVRDRNGVILKRAEISLSPSFLMSGSFICYTDSNGYFRLTGLPPGEFSIGVSLHDGPILPIDIPVEIKKGMVTRKDITLNWAPTD